MILAGGLLNVPQVNLRLLSVSANEPSVPEVEIDIVLPQHVFDRS